MATNNIIKKSALTPTVLIAGGAGFIGSNLAETLLLQNARVVVLDNFSSGKDNYISPLLQNPKFALFNADINKGIPEEIESVDYIFHLASVEAHMSDTNEVSLNSLLTNSLGTKVLLDFANKCKAKLLLVSSTNIYQGMMSSLNLDRYFGSTNQEERKYSHAEAKRYAEALVGEYYKRYNTDVRIVRIPEVYGPKMDLNTGAPISMFLKDLLDDKDLTLYGEGTDKEFYLYITDAVAGIIKALFNDHTEGKIYSLVDKEHFTTLELAYLLKSLAQREIQINFKNRSRSIDHPKINPDTSNLGELKWDTKVNLKEGLKMTLKWFGYESNEHSFKPTILIENKKQEQHQTETISGLISTPTNEVKETINDIKESFLKFGHKVDSIVHEVKELKPSTTILSENKTNDDLNSYKNKPKKALFNSTKGRVVAALITFLLIASFVLLALPAIQTYSYVKSAYKDLEEVPTKVTQLDSEGAAEYSNKAYKKIDRAQNSFDRLKWVFTLVRKTDSFNTYNSLLSSAKYFSRATYYGAKAVKPFESIVQVIRPDSKEVLDVSQVKESQLFLANAKSELQLASADFKKTDINKIPNAQKGLIIKYEEALMAAVEGVEIAEGLALDLPNIMGLDDPRKYLILFQNSNEIRATGGFIGSYAVLEINKGKIASLTIDDIYNPDGQIDVRDIKVTAPEPITTLLEEDRLYIRNANWDPNLTSSSKQIQDLFFKIDGSTFNGVIAIDLFFAKNLLNVTGPIFLTAYNEEISADNLYERTQFHSEFNYEEGSSQKKSFLTVLGSKLLEKLFSLERDKMPVLAHELNNSLEERHLSVSLNNSSFNTILEKKNWNGDLVKLKDESVDYLYVVNSNLGGTKANYYVENKMDYEVSSLTRDGLLRAKLTLDYKHTGESYAWPGGPYTNYVRIYTKSGTKLTGATLSKNGEAVEINKTGPLTKEEADELVGLETQEEALEETKVNASGTENTLLVLADTETTVLDQGNIFNEVVITEKDGYTIYEIPFTILPKEELSLVIEYDLPKESALGKDNKSYELYWQKQPGTEGDTINYSFNYPLGLLLKNTYPEMNESEGKVYIEDKLIEDKKYKVELK